MPVGGARRPFGGQKGSGGGGGSKGKGGARGANGAAKGAGGSRGAVAPGVNPFEVRGNKRQKQEVLNRRVKGANRNVAKARTEATERRKKTLLLEHKNRQSANNFVDRRFGEADQSMCVWAWC